MDSSSSSQQSQYPYPPSQQPYNPSRFQSYYSNYQYQQDPNQQQMYHHQQQQQQQQQYHHQQPQQQYPSYYPPNYSNSYPLQHPQTHQQWNHQEPPIHPPGVSIQPSLASHGQPHFQLPNQNNGYHLPQRTDGVGLGINHVAALAQLNQLAGSLGAPERPTSGLHGQSWYPQPQGFGPVIGGPGTYTGPGLGSGAFPGDGAGPSGLRSHVLDFQNLNLTSASQRNGDGEGKKESSCMSSEVRGLGIALPDLKAKKRKQKAAKEAKDSHVSDALDKLREQTREAVKGLESVAGPRPRAENFGSDPMMEDWVKQFEELAGSQDMESIVETLMQQLLSKEILHEPMREIGERYPKWLEDNKAKLSSEEYKHYRDQYELIRDLNKVYETEPSNFNKIVELMQKMQECGQPPKDIVLELAPDFDISTLGQLSPEMLESQQNCCIM